MSDDDKAASIKAAREMFETRAAQPRRIETLEVAGLGTVYLKGLTADEFDEFEAGCVQADGKGTRANRALLLRHCVVTAEGTKIFRDDHLDMLRNMDAAVTNPIAAKAMELCGLGKREEAKIEGN